MQLHWGVGSQLMSHFCLHNLTLLDSVSGMPICVCVHVCVCVCVCVRGGSTERVRARERPQENGVFAGALVVPASLPRLQTKPTYVFLSPPHPRPYTHSYTHTCTILCMCQQRLRESCTGEKRGNKREEAKEEE